MHSRDIRNSSGMKDTISLEPLRRMCRYHIGDVRVMEVLNAN